MINFIMEIKAKVIEEKLKNNLKKKISAKKQYWQIRKFDEEREKLSLEKKINPILSRLL